MSVIFRRAALLLTLLALVLILPTLVVGRSFQAALYSAPLEVAPFQVAYRLLDIDRLLSIRRDYRVPNVVQADIAYSDGRTAYIWQHTPEAETDSTFSEWILSEYDLISGKAQPLLHETHQNTTRIPYTSISEHPFDRNLLLLFDLNAKDYFVFDRTTREKRLILDLERPETGRWSPMITAPNFNWNHDGKMLAVVWDEWLYLVDWQTAETKQFALAESHNYYPVWSGDGQRLLLANYSSENKPLLVLELATGEFDPRLIEVEGMGGGWGPDNRWLYYMTLTGRDMTAPRTGHLFNLDTGETVNLQDIPALKGIKIEWLSNRDDRYLLIQSGFSFDSSRNVPSMALWLFDMKTHETSLLGQAVQLIDWDRAENTLIYTQLKPDERLYYKRGFETEAEPIYLGRYSGEYYGGFWDDTYTRMVAYSNPTNYRRGRLALVDIRSNTTTYLSPKEEHILSLMPLVVGE